MKRAAELRPYVGPRPFERDEERLFYGRDREANDLLSLVIAHAVVLFYAQSGAGKTSLLNARLIPMLEKEGFEVLPPARVRGSIPEGVRSEEISNIYTFNTLMSWVDEEGRPAQLVTTTLGEFLRDRPRLYDEDDQPLPRVLVFDQFEELFSSYTERWQDRRGFFEEISDVLKKDRFVRAVFVMREDYIARLDPYAALLPEKLRTRYRIERLRRNAALWAVKKPLKGTGRTFEAGAAEKLVDDLLKIRVETAQGGTAVITGEFVEAVQLQVVCQNLWSELPPEVAVISSKHLRSFGDVNQALARFYEDTIERTLKESDVKEGDLRSWFEGALITPAGTRGTVYRGAEATGGIPNTAVDVLENMHIIRGEWRAGARWYELTHDRFIEPIQEANRTWRSNRSGAEKTRMRLETRAAEWLSSGRDSSGLLDEIELLEAERWLAGPESNEIGYSEAVLSLVQASRAASERRRAEAQAAAARRLRVLAMALLAVFIVAVYLGLNAWKQKQIAVTKAKEAELARDEAVKAQAQAERAEQAAVDSAKAAQVARMEAVRARDDALRSARLAEIQRVRAEELQVQADSLRKIAEKRASRIDSLSQGYMARALAIQAPLQQQLGNDTLGVLLARQAYLFNERSPGQFQDDVYYALRRTLNAASFSKSSAAGGPDTLSGHSNWVTSVVFSPDGRSIASSGADSTIRVWRLQRHGIAPSVLRGHNAAVWSISFSPDGRTLASGSDDHTVRLWNLETQQSQVFRGHTDRVWCVAFSPFRNTLASASADSTVRVWGMDAPGKATTLRRHRASVRAVAFSSDGRLLASGGADSTVLLWDTRRLQSGPLRKIAQKARVRAVAFSPDGNQLASGGDDGIARLWEVHRPGSAPIDFPGNEKGVNSVSFSPDGRFLSSGGSDGTVRVWDLQKPASPPIVMRGHDSWVWSVAFGRDGNTLASASSDKTVRVWVAHAETLAGRVCDSVRRNLTQNEWDVFVGPGRPYERTCPELPEGPGVPDRRLTVTKEPGE